MECLVGNGVVFGQPPTKPLPVISLNRGVKQTKEVTICDIQEADIMHR